MVKNSSPFLSERLLRKPEVQTPTWYASKLKHEYIFTFLCLQGSCGISPHSRIVGGVNAKHGDWPWQVQLRTTYSFPYCGGSLVSDQWVVTATHCVLNESPSSIVVRYNLCCIHLINRCPRINAAFKSRNINKRRPWIWDLNNDMKTNLTNTNVWLITKQCKSAA